MGWHAFRGTIGAAGLTVLLAACTPPPGGAVGCTAALGAPTLIVDLFFGQSVPARGDLTEAEWQSFRNRIITANLPNGYTVMDANGAWMNPITRRTIEEPTKVLLVSLPDAPASLAAINRIRNAYQIQFRQQLVGMTVQRGCGSF
jgi:hypothetical protein